MQKNTVKYDQLIQAGRDAHAVLELAKKADTRISRRHEKTQRAAAIWYLSKRRKLEITLHDLYALYYVTPRAVITVSKQIQKAIQAADICMHAFLKSKDPGSEAVEPWRRRK